MSELEGVAKTLYLPLYARIEVSKQIPDYFYDSKALELEKILPPNAEKGSSEYTNLSSVARYHIFDREVLDFQSSHEECNVVLLGAGLETCCYRLKDKLTSQVRWYSVDLPDVIEAREKVLGRMDTETLIPGDMFDLSWTDGMDCKLPTLITVAGVFQYFHEEQIIGLIRSLSDRFPRGKLLFDATNTDGLKFVNKYVKKSGNDDAMMYFAVDDPEHFASITGTRLIRQEMFFEDSRMQLKKKVSFVSNIMMKYADKWGRAKTIFLDLTKD